MSQSAEPAPGRPEQIGAVTGRRHEVEREFVANALYLGIVLYAALTVIPTKSLPSDRDLVLLILGTGVGLILAHWFAFHVASAAVSSEGTSPEGASEEAGAQVAGGAAVAVLSVVPFLLLDGQRAVQVTLFLLGVLPAVTGYAIGRRRDHSPVRSVLLALLVLAVATGITALKVWVAH